MIATLSLRTFTPSRCRQKIREASVHVSLDKWVFTLNPGLKYHCWKKAVDSFYTKIVLQLIMSGTKETNQAIKIPSGFEFKLMQTRFLKSGE